MEITINAGTGDEIIEHDPPLCGTAYLFESAGASGNAYAVIGGVSRIAAKNGYRGDFVADMIGKKDYREVLEGCAGICNG